MEAEEPDGSRFVCNFCGKQFPTSTRYHKHVKLHSNIRAFRCAFPGCGKTFKRKPHLKRHLANHQAEKPHRCPHPGCGKTFPTSQKLARHARIHEALACNVCGERFRKRARLEEHQRAHAAGSDSGELICPECHTEVADKWALQRHMKRHRSYPCGQCKESFLRFQDVVKHRRTQHPKPILCPDCGKAYKSQQALNDHIKRVHIEGSVLMCPRAGCGQTFTRRSNLATHERTVHQGLKPFKCKDCGETFAYLHVLRRHRRVLHSLASSPPSEPAPPPCELPPPIPLEVAAAPPISHEEVPAAPSQGRLKKLRKSSLLLTPAWSWRSPCSCPTPGLCIAPGAHEELCGKELWEGASLPALSAVAAA